MLIGFRCDAGSTIGTGHLMRCLVLADELASRGHQCVFYVAALAGAPMQALMRRGHRVEVLESSRQPGPPIQPGNEHELDCSLDEEVMRFMTSATRQLDVVVLDHYALDRDWLTRTAETWRHAVALDDLGDRALPVDILIDPAGDFSTGRSGLRADTVQLFGPTYALVGPEFVAGRPGSLSRTRVELRHLMVSMGGADPLDVTGEVVDRLVSMHPEFEVTVVCGPSYAYYDRLRARLDRSGFRIVHAAPSLAPLLRETDLAIGAPAGSAWERCCMGVPSLAVVTHSNQTATARLLSRAGAALLVSSPDSVPAAVERGARELTNISQAAAGLVDGLGPRRVADSIESLVVT